MNKYTCSRCQKEFNNYNALRKHVGRIHKIHSIDFHVEFNLNGQWPMCKCGCNQKVEWSAVKKSFCDYCQGHQSRVKNNWGHNPKAIKASAKTRREQYENGERKVWNDGLTKECDDRLEKLGKKRAEKFTESVRSDYALRMKTNRLNGTIPTLYGEDSSRWQGGVSSVNQLARASNVLYKEWKYPILVRDGFKCTQCSNTKDLHVHHDKETFSEIIKKVMTIDDYEKLEEFDRKKEISDKVVAYHIENKTSGVTLCLDCHKQLHPSYNLI
jgi:hypothetical protein